MRRKGSAAHRPIPPPGGGRFQRDLLARQPLPKRGQDVGSPGFARRAVGDHRLHAKTQVVRTIVSASDITAVSGAFERSWSAS